MKEDTTAIDKFILDYRIKVGEFIKEIREKKGYSQDELAALMSINRSTISKIENGKFAITVDYLAKFGWHLKFDIQFIQDLKKK